MGIRLLRRDRVLRRLAGRRRHRGIGIEIRDMRIVVLVVVGVEGIEATVVEIITIPEKSVIRKVVRRISRDSCMIRVIRPSRMRNGERHRVLRNEGMAISNSHSRL